MPTYEYECLSCGVRFEKFQSMTAAPLKKCSSCGKKVQRLIGGGSGFLFRGSGFYQTDYRSSAYQKAAEKDRPVSKPAGDCGQGACKQPSSCATT